MTNKYVNGEGITKKKKKAIDILLHWSNRRFFTTPNFFICEQKTQSLTVKQIFTIILLLPLLLASQNYIKSKGSSPSHISSRFLRRHLCTAAYSKKVKKKEEEKDPCTISSGESGEDHNPIKICRRLEIVRSNCTLFSVRGVTIGFLVKVRSF